MMLSLLLRTSHWNRSTMTGSWWLFIESDQILELMVTDQATRWSQIWRKTHAPRTVHLNDMMNWLFHANYSLVSITNPHWSVILLWNSDNYQVYSAPNSCTFKHIALSTVTSCCINICNNARDIALSPPERKHPNHSQHGYFW